jgi:phosphatidylglycerol:prolipoprotein diacylglycerol transferase
MWVPVALFAIGPLFAIPAAHLAHVALYSRDPALLLEPFAGQSAVGFAVAVVPLAVVWFAWLDREHLWAELDGFASALAWAWAFGRLGCFLVHDHAGAPTLFPLGVRGICPIAFGSRRLACHDLGLYELLFCLAAIGGLAVLRERGAGAGIPAATAAIAYGTWRFLADFLRLEDTDPRYALLTPAQWFAPMLIAAGVVGIFAAGVAREPRGCPPTSAATAPGAIPRR